MADFEYTGENLQELERMLSAERLAPYVAASGDLKQAVRLYEQNVRLSEALYGVLQGLEVTLRNAVHSRLADDFASTAWYGLLELQPEQAAMLKRAKLVLEREGKPPDPGRVVAELSFGFWTGLTSARYETLWREHLYKIVPRRPVQRVEMHDRLNSIRKLRNRVAHHEPIIFSGKLERYANQIFDTIAWLSPMTARWVRSNASLAERFATYRSLFPEIAGAGR